MKSLGLRESMAEGISSTRRYLNLSYLTLGWGAAR